MKKQSFRFLLPIAVTLILLSTGCKKDANSNSSKPSGYDTSQSFKYSDADALLAAVNTETTYTIAGYSSNITIGTAVAVFFSTRGGTSYSDEGTVTVNDDNNLTKQSNNAYAFQPTATSYTGIDYGSSAKWKVTGDAYSNINGFTFNTFPSTPVITSDTAVTLANGYTFQIQSVSGADSIIFVMGSGNSYVHKTTVGSATSVTFSANELSALSASDYGLLQASPYHIQKNTDIVPGKNVYFVNESNINVFAKFK